ncbi:hypothetical protein PHET_03905 [Paragonimus heterotremus]|uniref:G-protein coupled receptors family 1 profile domain-containing protein n=1 Tax=Paragonimus heterotremus TaxID=100268 RepID=A0A8J4WHJ3_9TREM|nr:hypothetical protein PHET_03905 [Paragonimus heterotremus]
MRVSTAVSVSLVWLIVAIEIITAESAEELEIPRLPIGVVVPMIIVMVIGFGLNAIVLYALTRVDIASKATKFLLKNGCVLDMLSTVVVIHSLVTNPGWVYTNSIVGWIHCHFLFSGFYIYLSFNLVACNLVCLTLDRFWAVYFPTQYKSYINWEIGLSCTLIIVYSVSFTIPTLQQVQFTGGTCIIRLTDHGVDLANQINVVFTYVIPVIAILIFHFLTVQRVRKLTNNTPACAHNQCSADVVETAKVGQETHPPLEHSSSGPSANVEQTSNPVTSAMSMSTFGYCVLISVKETTGFTLGILHQFDLVDFRNNSVLQLYYNFLSGLMVTLIPIIQFHSVRVLRMWASKYLLECWSSCRGVFAKIGSTRKPEQSS